MENKFVTHKKIKKLVNKLRRTHENIRHNFELKKIKYRYINRMKRMEMWYEY